MPATVRNSELTDTAQMMLRLAAIDGSAPMLDLDNEEITLVLKHRRDKLVKALANKGIDVKADQLPDVPLRAVEDVAA